MAIIVDRVQETTTTTGTGTVDLDGAVTGFQGFVAGAGDGAEVYYCIAGQDGGGAAGEWEVGIGTVTDAATDTLSRDTVLASSNSGAAVNFSAGTKDVFINMPPDAAQTVIAKASPSSASSVDFPLPSGYAMFKIIGWVTPASDATLYLRFDDGGGFDNTNEYEWYGNQTNQAGTSSGVSATATTGIAVSSADVESTGDNNTVTIDMTISRALDAKHTQVVGTIIRQHGGGSRSTAYIGGIHTVAAALTDARLILDTGNIADGELRLIGIP